MQAAEQAKISALLELAYSKLSQRRRDGQESKGPCCGNILQGRAGIRGGVFVNRIVSTWACLPEKGTLEQNLEKWSE